MHSVMSRTAVVMRGGAQAAALGGALAGALALAAPARAQQEPAPSQPDVECNAAAPETVFTRMVLYASARAEDSATMRVLPYADVLVQAMADQAGAVLGAGKDTLPRGEPTVTWHRMGQGVHLVGYRDGRVRWEPGIAVFGGVGEQGEVERMALLAVGGREHRQQRDSATVLLGRLVAAAQGAGYAFLWPDGLVGDSVAFDVVLDPEPVRRAVELGGGVRPAAPLFSVAVPVGQPPRKLSGDPPEYPSEARDARAIGNVVLWFRVDTLGRPVVESIRDVWPADRPRETGALGRYYEAFVRAAREAVARWRFEPARLAGCATPTSVVQPLTFRLEP